MKFVCKEPSVLLKDTNKLIEERYQKNIQDKRVNNLAKILGLKNPNQKDVELFCNFMSAQRG